MSKLEITLLDFANKVLDARNGVTNPTLGELIDNPKDKIKALIINLLKDETVDMSDQTYTYLVRKVEEL